MTTKRQRLADVQHPDRTDMWHAHRAAYMDMCPVCSVRLERMSRISRLYLAFKEFGYTTLTREEVATAYDIAIARPATADDGIIAMLTRSQLIDAGIVPDSDDTGGSEAADYEAQRGLSWDAKGYLR